MQARLLEEHYPAEARMRVPLHGLTRRSVDKEYWVMFDVLDWVALLIIDALNNAERRRLVVTSQTQAACLRRGGGPQRKTQNIPPLHKNAGCWLLM